MRLTLPSDLAYWRGGTDGVPPLAEMIFEVELLEVKPALAAQASNPR